MTDEDMRNAAIEYALHLVQLERFQTNFSGNSLTADDLVGVAQKIYDFLSDDDFDED